MKKTLQILFALLITATVSAQNFELGATFDDGTFNYAVTVVGDGGTILDEVEVTSIITPTENVTIPATVLEPLSGFNYECHVTSIGEFAFATDATLLTVILPTSVVSIKQKAFQQTNLNTINLENVVDFIGNSQFAETKLVEVDLSSCKTFPGYQFYYCSNLKKVNNLNNAVSFGHGVLRRSGVTELNLPSSLASIGNQLFRQCASLVQVQLNWADPEKDVTIDPNVNVFGNIDPADIKFYVPAGTKAAYEAIFPWNLAPAANIIEGDMPELTVGDTFTVAGIHYVVSSNDPDQVNVGGVASPAASVTIPLTATDPNNSRVYDVAAIGDGAFIDDATLTSVTLPTSVTTLEANAFSGCVNLETINLENIVTVETQNVFFNCPKLTTVNFTAATSIGNFAFHSLGNSTLSSISIPVVETIGASAFRTTQIPSINLPATVSSIAANAFMDCTALTGIQVNWTDANDIPVIDVSVFTGLTISGITLYVPAGTSALYAAALVWQDFNIQEGTLSTNAVDKALGFSLYPNPTNGIVSIKSSKLIDASITVYDINGRALLSKTLSNTASEINISNLASGLYIFRVQTENGEFSKRILKQ